MAKINRKRRVNHNKTHTKVAVADSYKSLINRIEKAIELIDKRR